MAKNRWVYGDKSKIAEAVGLTRQRITDFTNGHRSADYETAEKLVEAAKELGYVTTVLDWMAPAHSKNPLFNRGSDNV